MILFGTRPEGIKFAPLVKAMQKDPFFDLVVCSTGQHKEMLDQVLEFFEIAPDISLDIMTPGQTLASMSSLIIRELSKVISEVRPELVFVQGDTTSAFLGALAAHYEKVKVAHLEAGLRSGNKFSPFPEEINRKLIGSIADLHFAPTEASIQNLLKEGIVDGLHEVGNTVIDALFLGLELIKGGDVDPSSRFPQIDFKKRIILMTSHRRENFGEPMKNISDAVTSIHNEFDDIEIVYPVHLNPNVQGVMKKNLGGFKRIHLINPLDYKDLIWFMEKSHLILTDSGGIQEEAPSLGKPVVVLRDTTERMEGIEAGNAVLVGTDKDKIFQTTSSLLRTSSIYNEMANTVNPYGDGKTSGRIVEILKNLG